MLKVVLTAATAAALSSRSGATALPAHRLLVEFMPSPSVVDKAAPRFSWHVATAPSARRVSQAAYQLQVCAIAGPRAQPWDGHTWECDEQCSPAAAAAAAGRACAWDSGRVNSSAHWGLAYNRSGAAAAQPLQSDGSYAWRVKWWASAQAADDGSSSSKPTDDDDDSGKVLVFVEAEAEWSAVARMDTAFLGGAKAAFPGGAEWIGLAPPAFAAAPLGTTQLRTTFELPAGAVATHARAYVASPGYYSLRVDGALADEERVLGAFTVFTRKILYDVLDVTALLMMDGGGGGVAGNGSISRGSSSSSSNSSSSSSSSSNVQASSECRTLIILASSGF